MKFKFLNLILLLTISTAFYTCAEGSEADQATEEMVSQAENTMADVGAELKDESDNLSREFTKARKKLSSRMEELESDMEDASEETKAELQKEWDSLENYRNKIDARMEKVGDNMQSGWANFKGDVKKGWGDFTAKSTDFLEEVEMAIDPKD